MAWQRRMGRCAFAAAAVMHHGSLASAMAQLSFDFLRRPGDGEPADELAVMVGAEGVKVGDVLSEIVRRMKATAEGRAQLRRLAADHAEVLLTPAAVQAISQKLLDARNELLAGLGRAAGWRDVGATLARR